MTKLQMQTSKTARKVYGSAAGAGVSATFAQDLAELSAYFLQDVLVGDLPADIEAGLVRVLVVIVVTVSTYLAGRFTSPAAHDVVVDGTGHPVP